MVLPPNCSFVLSVERGKFESQAVLLVESLRRFGGRYSDCPIYAVSPRPSRQMGKACHDSLQAMGVQVVIEDLVSPNEEYGPTARLAACAWAEKNIATEILVGLDDDLFFAGPPDFTMDQADFLARPVDVKGMCTSGPEDPFDPYWRKIARVCGVEYEKIAWVETTADRVSVKASYNAGMIAVRPQLGLFRRAQEMLQLLRQNNLSPYPPGDIQVFASTGFVGTESSRWWGTSQAVLSLAATQLESVISIAPQTYNVPIHLAEAAEKLGRSVQLNQAILVHYHWLLDRDYLRESTLLPGGDALPSLVFQWLRSRTPLSDFRS